MPPERRIEFRIGIHLGDVVEEGDGDLMGDGVNIAARLEGVCEPGGVCLSGAAYEQVRDKVKETFVDLGEKALKNIARPIRAYGLALERSRRRVRTRLRKAGRFSLPDKPSIAVLPFQNMSGDPEQDYFADGMVEDIITGLSRIKWLFVIARNSSFVYKGKAVDVRQVGRELGVRYVLEGGMRKAGGRVRIRRSSSRRKLARIFGPTNMMARWRTSSSFRIGSLIRSSASSSRACAALRSSGPGGSVRIVSTPTTSSCALCRTWKQGCPTGPERPFRCSRRR